MTAEAVTPVPSSTERITAALWMAGRGFGIFPVWSTRDGQCRCPAGPACSSPGKHPITVDGFKSATTDPDKIRTFLSARSEPNYGMVPPDGVFAWDVDTDEERARLATLEARHGALPATLRNDTGNGQHVFLRWPDTHPRPIHKMFGYVTRWGSGSMQGYVVGPLSIHVSGRVYRSAKGSAQDIATLPETWARAAVDATSTITFQAGSTDAGSVQPGGRHDWLRDRARFYSGTLRDPSVLFAAVWAENERLTQPKTEDEVRRAIGDALTKFPADPVEVDAETGEIRVTRDSGLGMIGRGQQEDFPGDPNPSLYGGLLGEVIDFLAESTDASKVALMGSLLAICGAVVPAIGYFQRDHTATLWVALVGDSFVGRKGTAMQRVQDAIGDAIGLTHLNRTKLGGINSGEGLVAAMERRQLDTGPVERARTTALIVEEEYANLLAAGARENSTLDMKLRVAFDAGMLANVTKAQSQKVDSPYWLTALIAITPHELRDKIPAGALKSGSSNRWLYLPVVKRDITVPNIRPVLPEQLRIDIAEARRVALEERPLLEVDPRVDRALNEYGEFLSREAVGLVAYLSPRFPVMALRAAMVHAAVERSPIVRVDHFDRGLALTEYARSGVGWVFGHTIGNPTTTLMHRYLLAQGELSLNQITQTIVRDPLKRQEAIDDLERMGYARVETRPTKGRPMTVLALVPGANVPRTYVQAGSRSEGGFRADIGGVRESSSTPPLADMHESPVSRSDALQISPHETFRKADKSGGRTCPVCGQQHPVGTTCSGGAA